MKENKNKKKKLKFKIVLLLIAVVFIIYNVTVFILNQPIHDVVFKGNSIVNDTELLEYSGITDDNKFITTKVSKVKENILKNAYVKDVEVDKVFFSTFEINITENKTLFYYLEEDKIILEGNNKIDSTNILGLPTLVNYTPEDVLENFINKLSLIDINLIYKISEIEYAPNIKNDIMLDEERFIFKMNDSNTVHVNIINLEKFSNYNKILEIETKKGILYLDSSNNGNVFDIYE
ncbi:MAG: FtsQ-type POTRA domain-containing protein [bacterium]